MESQQHQKSVEELLKKLGTYGLRRKCDFDKYTALSMAEDLVSTAKETKHEKSAFLAAAAQALRDRVEQPLDRFQAYFLALFNDKDYVKVLDSLAKVDKALRTRGEKTSSRVSTDRPQEQGQSNGSFERNIRYRCHYCGVAGHTAPYCFRRRRANQFGRGRFAPYRPGRGGSGSST